MHSKTSVKHVFFSYGSQTLIEIVHQPEYRVKSNEKSSNTNWEFFQQKSLRFEVTTSNAELIPPDIRSTCARSKQPYQDSLIVEYNVVQERRKLLCARWFLRPHPVLQLVAQSFRNNERPIHLRFLVCTICENSHQ